MKKILIIDDEPDICELLDLTLGRMDINTETASVRKPGSESFSVSMGTAAEPIWPIASAALMVTAPTSSSHSFAKAGTAAFASGPIAPRDLAAVSRTLTFSSNNADTNSGTADFASLPNCPMSSG